MEDLITSLEDQVRAKERPVSPSTLARQAESAIEIECEMLRDNVQHLEKKLASIQSTLEDTRHTSEREEAAARERLARHKEREDAVRKELAEAHKELERVGKSEEGARARVEEIEEALRENTVALENARAEIEGLRAEIAVRLWLWRVVEVAHCLHRISRAMLLMAGHHLRVQVARQVSAPYHVIEL